MEYLENHNANPKPFVWTKSSGEILKSELRLVRIRRLHSSATVPTKVRSGRSAITTNTCAAISSSGETPPTPAKENQCTKTHSSITLWESCRFKSAGNCFSVRGRSSQGFLPPLGAWTLYSLYG
jgi:hypothetical protein